ncbi:MAG: S16 family serine protease [Candidatus Hadarchaeia archaeon]
MKDSSKVLISSLVLISLILAAFSIFMYRESQRRKIRINEIEEENRSIFQEYENLLRKYETLNEEKEGVQSDYDEIKKRMDNLQSEYGSLSEGYDNLEREKDRIVDEYESLNNEYERIKDVLDPFVLDYYFLAVSGEEGSVNSFGIEIVSGDGSLLLEIKDTTFERNTQMSSQLAREISDLHTDENLETDYDVCIDLDKGDRSKYLSGPSAGAAQVLAIISAVKEKPLDNDILVTGALEADGRIGKVDGVEEKVIAARDFGASKVMVPEGQYVDVEGIEVIEIAHIEEAMVAVGLDPKDVDYPGLDLTVADFSFVEEVSGYEEYDSHSGMYSSRESVRFYLEIEGFELDQEDRAEYELYLSLFWPDGGVDTHFDDLKLSEGSTDGVRVLWFDEEISPPEEGWTEGEFYLRFRIVDGVGQEELNFSRKFEVV